MLLGCSFFSHDNERDMQQEVAVVKAYNITNIELDENGDSVTYNYKTAKKILYKRDLLEYANNNSSSFASSFSGNPEGLYKYCIRMMISTELVTNEVDALIACDRIKWGVAEQNEIRKSLYNIVDNTLFSLKNNILSERGQEELTKIEGDASTADTTYPVKPDETDDDDDDLDEEDPEIWAPDRVSWPGVHGDSDERSLDRQAMTRFIALIKSRVKDDFRLNKSDRAWLKKKINAEIKAIDNLIDTQGIEAVYPRICDYSYPMKESTSEFGYIMYYLSGENIERSQKITAMQDYLTDRITVQYDEVLKSYNTMLNEQRSQYENDISAYDSAMSGGSTTVLYHANTNYFYVKHILLPFSDDQKAALTEFKNRPDIKNLQEDEQKEKIEDFRADLVESIMCYPHVKGEDDKDHPMSVDDVMAHVRSVMTPLAGNVKRANDAFNDLIYLYNTDPGAFNNDKGYVVKYTLDDGENETYMQEFADAAREMRKTLAVGQVYGQPVITDYGVHIMYLSSVPQLGAVSLNDYTSPDRSQTYYELLEQPIKSARESASYSEWQNNILTYNYNKYSKVYTKNFSDLWED
ncbi:MAG: hypothetical protein J1F69_02450 [Clostridiales bacterium]|nr:hypothetical protein [Clostridiales bacterium]